MPVPDYQSLMLPALEALPGSVEVLLSKVHTTMVTDATMADVLLSRNGALGVRCLAEMGTVPGRQEFQQEKLVLTINPKVAQFFRGQVRAMRPVSGPVPVWTKHAIP